MLELLNQYAHGFTSAAIVAACEGGGVFTALEAAPLTDEELARRLAAHPGQLAVALRALIAMGWIDAESDGRLHLRATREQRALPADVTTLFAADWRAGLAAPSLPAPLARWLAMATAGWPDAHPDAAALLDGALIVPLALALRELGALTAGPWFTDRPWAAPVTAYLARLGWCEAPSARPTTLGTYLAERVMILGTVASYAPMLRALPDVIFGDAEAIFTRDADGGERHVLRHLNVVSSGFQHGRFFADVEALIIAYFDQEPLADQPRFLADMGCGDGTFLRQLWHAIVHHTRRGRALDQFPLTLIGADFNAAARAATEHTLRDLPHVVVEGDIGDPEGFVARLRALAIDPDHVLHVRSFLDHEVRAAHAADAEPSPADGSVHVARGGARLDAGRVLTDLTAHLRRWAAVAGRHGLMILEVHSLPATVVRANLAQCENLHFDAYHGFSRQHLVEADAFFTAAAAAGLHPRPGAARHYPRELGFARITLHWFTARAHRIRHARLDDLDALCALEDRCWPAALRAPRAELARRITAEPRGCWVVVHAGAIVGAAYAQRIAGPAALESARFATLARLHDPAGAALQLLGLHVDPAVRDHDFGDHLLAHVLAAARLRPGIAHVVGVSRCRDFPAQRARGVAYADHAPHDPVLRFHLCHGARIAGLIAGYRPEDVDNDGHGVIVIHAVHGERAPALAPAQASEAEVRALVDDAIGRVHPAARGRIDLDRPLMELGLDSMALMELRALLERQLAIALPAAFLFSHGTPRAIARALAAPSAPSAPLVIEETPDDASPPVRADRDRPRIAIVGMACRFPGGARDPHSYWNVLVADRDAITAPPADRLALTPALPARAGFLDDVAGFDAAFFNIAPKEARLLDPQHRLVLETCWEALEDAGIAPREVSARRTGVYTGIFSRDYERLATAAGEAGHPYVPSGNAAAMASGRIAYVLDARGPAISIDTSCSSSLVGVHLAVQALRTAECQLALVSGVNLILGPELDDAFRAAGMLAADGHCKTFDAAADGYVRAEGCASVVLERLDDALAAGHRVLAVIEGSAVAQDGASNGLTAPNGAAQEAVIRAALADAGIAGRAVSYVEAHGTGTQLGDPVELAALSAVFADPARDRPLSLGSAKTQIGHTEAAAGLAGLLKVVLAMGRRILPGNVHLRTVNPEIDLAAIPAQIPRASIAWGAPGERLCAGVSSFGFSGTNAHVVVTSPPAAPPHAARPDGVAARLFLLSARDGEQLAALAARTAGASLEDLPAVCRTSQRGRAVFAHRVAIAADEPAAFVAALTAIATGDTAHALAGPAEVGAPAEVGVLCAGQGSHDPGAGRLLFEREPVFRAAIVACERALADELPLALRDLLFDPGRRDLLGQTRFAQPALFAFEYALAELWADWGLQPAAVMGHSLGEYVAATLAGVFEPMRALRLVAARGRLMASLPPGGMLAVMGDEAALAPHLAARGDRVALAARNGPSQLVVAGPHDDLAALAGELGRAGLRSVALDVSHAFHSPMVEPILDDFAALVEAAAPRRPTRTLIGNLRGAVIDDEAATAAYWCRHLREPVRFFEGVQTLRARGVTAFLELGPRPTLVGLARAGLTDRAALHFVAGVGTGADELAGLRRSVAQLFVAGVDLDWAAIGRSAGPAAPRAPLPTYPFARQRVWLHDAPAHPLLGARVADPAPGERAFASTIRSDRPAFLGEHWVYDAIVVLGVTYLEMALAAAARLLPGGGALIVEDVTVWAPLVLRAGTPARLRLRAIDDRFEIHSSGEDPDDAWTRHATGRIARGAIEASASLPRLDGEPVALTDYYDRMQIYYGPRLRNIRALARQGREAIGDVRLADDEAADCARYEIHPALLDACFQCVFALIYAHETHREPFVPLACTRIELHKRGVRAVRVHVRLHAPRAADHNQTHTADLRLFTPDGEAVAIVDGLQLKRAAKTALLPARADRVPGAGLFCVDWQADARTVALPAPPLGELGAALDAIARGYARAALDEIDAAVPAQRRQLAHLRSLISEGPAAEDPGAQLAELRAHHPALAAELALLERCGPAVASVLRGERDPIALIFPDGALEAMAAFYREAVSFAEVNDLAAQTAAVIAGTGGAPLRVLEVGAGTGSLTAHVLPLLGARCATYVASDVSPAFGERAARKFAAYPALRTAILDVEADASNDALTDFDLILAGNVLHATADLRASVARLTARLAPGGSLIVLEGCQPRAWIDLVFGLTAGWWRFADGRTHPIASREHWRAVLGAAGLVDVRDLTATPDEHALYPQAVFVARRPGAVARARVRRLVLGEPRGIAGALCDQLTQLAAPCALAPVTALDTAARSIVDDVDEVVLVVDDDQPADPTAPTQLAAQATQLAARALHLIQALVARPAASRLRLITRGARAIGSDGPSRAASAAVWGVAAVAALEHPELASRCLDVDTARGVVRELLRHDDEREVAVRDGRRWLARLDRCEAPANHAPALRADATYLITGGLGGLGQLTARHLIEQGARHLVLLTRDADKAARGAPALADHARVETWAIDVGDPAQLTAALARIARELPPLGGVIHAVGVLDDGALLAQTAPRFAGVLAPKLTGAAVLAAHTAALDLDFFVVFASAVGLVGAPGQANHAAANAVLAALAETWRAEGRRAIAIDWGPWADVGAATHGDRIERWIARGVAALPPTAGLALFDRALATGRARVAALALQPGAPLLTQAPLFERLRAPAPIAAPIAPSTNARAALRACPIADRRDALTRIIRDLVAASLGLPANAAIAPRRGFRDLGMDSLTSLELRARLARALELERLPATLAFDYPTIQALSDFLADGPLRDELSAAPAVIPAAIPARRTDGAAIAIVGAGCRLPGGVVDLDALWAVLRDGVDAITPVPAARWDADAYAGQITSRFGGFLSDLDQFDAEFFAISPREARTLDPQQRLLLEVTWEALENAGIAPARLAGTRTGVFVGICSFDYALRLLGDRARIDAHVGTGGLLSPAAGRLSYVLGLVGPSMAVDTACSSSLLAVHLACQSLRSGEADLALAGGVNCMLDPALSINFSRAGMLAPDGRCKPFSARADGFVRAEGCGVVVLKRLADAEAAGDPILAVIRGSATNQDGRSSGLMAPSGPSQQAVVRRALADARVAPAEVGYVEAHGTGTALGDPIEAGALQAVFAGERAAPLVVGSLKSNLGHMEGAAGIGGLLKAALCLVHREIPPTLHVDEPSPHIEWTGLEIARSPRSWPSAGPAIAGVSSFGFAGTNVHVVLEAAPRSEAMPERAPAPHLLVLSARSEAALDALAEAHAARLDALDAADWPAWCRTAAISREHLPHRLAVIAHDPRSAAAALTTSGWCARGRAPIDRRPRLGLWIAAHAEGDAVAAAWRAYGVIADVMIGAGAGLITAAQLAGAIDADGARRATALLADGAPLSALAELPWRAGERALYAAGIDAPVGVDELRAPRWWQGVPREVAVSEAVVDAHPLAALLVAGACAPSPRVIASPLGADRADVLARLAALHVIGAELRWDAIVGSGRRLAGRLPTYPWQKRRFWAPALPAAAPDRDAVLGAPVPLADPALRVWTSQLARAAHSGLCLDDHRLADPALGERCVVPASLYFELARRAGGARLRDVEIERSQDVGEAGIELQLTVRDDDRFIVYGRASGAAWTRYAVGKIDTTDAPLGAVSAVDDVGTPEGADALYADAAARGLHFGPSFRPLRRAAIGRDAAVGELALDLDASPAIHDGLHPVIWDGCMQLADALAQGQARGRYLPVRVAELRTRPIDPSRGPLRACATPRGARCFDVALFDGAGQLAAELRGLELQLADGAAPARWLVQLAWRAQPARVDVAIGARAALEARAHHHITRALDALGWTAHATPDKLGVAPRHRALFARLVEIARGTPPAIPGDPPEGPEAALVERCGEALDDVLRGQRDPLAVIFPGGDPEALAAIYRDSRAARVLHAQLVAAIRGIARPGQPLAILEIGAGTGGTTAAVLPTLDPARTRYTFTDVGPAFVHRARERFADYPFVDYAGLDIDCDPADQGFAGRRFDVIIAANVVHAARDVAAVLARLRDLLAPGGHLALIEGVERCAWVDLCFGMTEGWWAFTDRDRRADHPLLSRAAWTALLPALGFARPVIPTRDDESASFAFPQALLVAARDPAPRPISASTAVAILADSTGHADALAAALRARDIAVRVIDRASADASLAAWLRDDAAWAARAEVIDCTGLAIDETAQIDAAAIASCTALLPVIAQLRAFPGAIHLRLITCGAAPIASGALTGGALAHAVRWGLARVIPLEHAAVRTSCHDLDPTVAPAVAVAALAHEIAGDEPGEPAARIAYRGPARLVGELAPLARGDHAPAISIADDAGMLITGGLGGLGLLVAEWLVRRGARRLFLLARGADPSTLTPAQAAAVAALRAAGAEVHLLRADVGDPDQLAAALGELRRVLAGARLAGVFHAAGVLDDGALANLDGERFARVLRPKLVGAWLLHLATLHDPLDHFVMFSSAASLLGNAGQANHAAANAFLDALCVQRAAHGLPARAIAWGPIAGVGAGRDHAMSRAYRGTGMGAMTAAQALAAFERALAGVQPLIGVLPIDAAPARDRRTPPPDTAPPVAIAPRLAAPIPGLATMGTRRRRLVVETQLRAAVIAILDLEADARPALDRGFFDLGFDSLTSLELRERLERALGLSLPSTLVLLRPTLAELLDDLVARLDAAHGATPAPAPAAVAAFDHDALATASDDALVPFIDQTLADLLRGEPS